jgi:hypothetical protein
VAQFYDAAVLGLGAIKAYPGKRQVQFERVFPGLIIADETNPTLPPRSLYQVGYYPSDMLTARFGSGRNRAAIRDARGKRLVGDDQPDLYGLTYDLVETVEAWHLPPAAGAGGGRHIICCPDATLWQGAWDRDRFPFSLLRWSVPVIGWYPRGLVEDQDAKQQQVNKLVASIQDSMNIHRHAITFAEEGTLTEKALKNVVGQFLEYKRGTNPPKMEFPPSLNSDVFAFVKTLNEWIYQETGVSMMSASSQQPAGIVSAIAMRTRADLETGRHALLSEASEDAAVDLAEITVDACQDLNARIRSQKETAAAREKDYEEDDGAGYVSRYVGRRRTGYEEIDWASIDMERDAAELAVEPASYLPQTPMGRISTVMDMKEGGMIDTKAEMLELAQMPDLEGFTSMETAALEDIDMQIELMLMRGEPQYPEPYQDLTLALKRVTSALLRARMDKVPDERVQLLQDYLDKTQELATPPAPPPEMMPQGGPPPGAPGGTDGAPSAAGVPGAPSPLPIAQ